MQDVCRYVEILFFTFLPGVTECTHKNVLLFVSFLFLDIYFNVVSHVLKQFSNVL